MLKYLKEISFFNKKNWLFILLMGFISIFSTIIAAYLKVGPNVNLSLMYFSAVIVGASLGPVPGIIAAIIGVAYTPILWGNPWNWIFTVPLAALTGIFSVLLGLRPFLAAIFSQSIVGLPSLLLFFNLYQPDQIGTFFWWMVFLKQTVEVTLCALITEFAFGSTWLNWRIPRTVIKGPKFILNNKWLRNPLCSSVHDKKF